MRQSTHCLLHTLILNLLGLNKHSLTMASSLSRYPGTSFSTDLCPAKVLSTQYNEVPICPFVFSVAT